MDKLNFHRKSPNQARAAKKKAVRVVYISNPMRVKATAAQFKALVQELTGRDSDFVADQLSTLDDMKEETAAGGRVSGSGCTSAAGEQDDHQQQRRGQQQQQEQQEHDSYRSVGSPVDVFDDVFTPQVLEDLAACVPSSLHHDRPPVVDNIRRWGDGA